MQTGRFQLLPTHVGTSLVYSIEIHHICSPFFKTAKFPTEDKLHLLLTTSKFSKGTLSHTLCLVFSTKSRPDGDFLKNEMGIYSFNQMAFKIIIREDSDEGNSI